MRTRVNVLTKCFINVQNCLFVVKTVNYLLRPILINHVEYYVTIETMFKEHQMIIFNISHLETFVFHFFPRFRFMHATHKV